MIVRLTPAAEADVRAIYAWYKYHGKGIADDFKRTLDAALARIGLNPRAYPQVHGVVRRAVLPRFPYCIFYVHDESEFVVHGVFHGHRDPSVWRRRHDA